MDNYDGMTNADVMSASEMAEYDQDAELLLDAQDEERQAAEEADQHDDGETWDGLADGEER